MSRAALKPLARYRYPVIQGLPWLLLLSFAASALAYLATTQFPPAHEIHFSYLVSLREREPSSTFRFDGYYALQATDLFSATLAAWVGTPEIIAAAFEQAGLPLKTKDPRRLAKAVSAKKSAPQLVEVVVRHEREDTARQLAAGLQTVMLEQVARYHRQGIPALTFAVVPTESWSGLPVRAMGVVTTAVFVFTFIIGLNVVLFRESLR